MKIRKILAAITSVALVGTMLAGCDNNSGNSGTSSTPANSTPAESNGGGDATANDEKDVKLTVWGPQEEQTLLKEMCEAFAAANPDQNCEFTYAVVGEPDAQGEINKDLDKAGDVFAFPLDQFPSLADAGALYPVIDTATVTSENTESNIAVLSKDGKLMAYPNVAETLCLYYDKSKLSDDEVKSLETILAKDLDSGVTNFAMTLDNGFYNGGFFFANGCTLFGADGNDPTQCDFASDAGVEVGNYMYDLFHNAKAKCNFTDDTIKAGFAEGTLAAAISGPWNSSAISESLGENYGVTKLPTIKLGGTDKQLMCFANLKAIGVNAHTAFPKTASALAVWLTNAENQAKRATVRNLGAVNTKVDASQFADNPTINALNQQSQFTVPALHIAQADKYWNPMDALGKDMIADKVTKDNMKESLEKTVESILATI